MKNNKKQYGLVITWRSKYDPRRLRRSKKFGAFVDVLKITDFDIAPNQPILNQGNSFLCTAKSNATISGIQEGVQLSPEYAYAKTNLLMRVRHSQGADPNSAMKAHCKFGCLEQKDNPFKLEEKGQYFVEDPQNWDITLDTQALIHRKKSYMECDQGKDKFDSIRIAMWQSYQTFLQTNNKSDLRAVSLGFYWLPDFQYVPYGIIPNNTLQPKSNGSGHNVVARGQKTINGEPYLIVQNSYGKEVGNLGLYYFPRAVVNKYVLFSKTFEDIDPNEEKLNQWNFMVVLLDKLVKLYSVLVALVIQKKTEPDPPEPKPMPEPHISRIKNWADAICIYENANPINNNPGNIKGLDGKFLKFPFYKDGYDYLCDYLLRAATNRHKSYRPEMTLLDFFFIYAPVNDNNNPTKYAQFVADKLGIYPLTKIKELV